MLFLNLFILAIGLIVGSFLSASIYRIPFGKKKGAPTEEELRGELDESSESAEKINKNISLVNPRRSLCPKCEKQLFWWHNIPLFSWIILRGKCWFCKSGISVRYPLVELLSAFFAVASFYSFDLPTAILVYVYCCILIVISFIDIEYYIIPDVISYPATMISILIVIYNSYFHYFSWPIVETYSSAIYGVLAGAGFLFLVAELFFRIRGKMGLGLGDVKLLLFTGILFGPGCALTSIFAGSFLGSVIGLLLLMLSNFKFGQRYGLGTPLPFGPFLALGALIYLFFKGYGFMGL